MVSALMQARQRKAETADPYAAPDLGPLYRLLAEDPDVAYRGSILPMVRTKAGETRLGMPQMALDAGRGIVDLLAGPHTGQMSPYATQSMVDLAASSAMQAPQQGIVGMFAGKRAATAPVDQLARAEAMTAHGADPREVWNVTGWFKGPEGKWKWEIDDSGAQIGKKAAEDFVDTDRMAGTAPRVLWHNDLYEAYPELRKTDVGIDRAASRGYNFKGKYSQGDAPSGIPDAISGTAASAKSARELLLHELQHGVQGQEGFAKGGNNKFLRTDTKEDRAILQKAWETINQPADLETFGRHGFDPEGGKTLEEAYAAYVAGQAKKAKQFPDAFWQRELAEMIYRNSAGEAEARAVQKRMDYTPEQRRQVFPLDDYDVPLDRLIVRQGAAQ